MRYLLQCAAAVQAAAFAAAVAFAAEGTSLQEALPVLAVAFVTTQLKVGLQRCALVRPFANVDVVATRVSNQTLLACDEAQIEGPFLTCCMLLTSCILTPAPARRK